jgi:ketosteroid isomerase-like protein
MTPDENTQTTKRAYAAFKSGDMAALMATYADDVTWEVYGPSTIPTAGTRRGIAGVKEFFGALDAAMSAQSFEPREFIAQGDQVVVLGDYVWTVKANGRSFKANFAHVATLRDGKIIRFREYTDTAAAVAAFAG